MQKDKSIIIDGIKYSSINNAAKELNIPRQTLDSRLSTMTENSASPAEERILGSPKPVVYKGKTYANGKIFAAQFGLSYAAVKKQLQRGKTAEEIINHHNKKMAKGMVKKYGRTADKKKSL